MTGPLAHPVYRRLFAAQVVALLGTGLATVALGLLAWELAGTHAGQVLGTALAIKMVAYVTLAPLAQALAERWPRRSMLVVLDVMRACVALALPFVTEIWQVYLLVFLLQAASAGFTPTLQATIPDVLPDEDDYTRALSLFRLASDLENLLSPILAAILLTVVSFSALFVGTVAGFLVSALLVLSVVLPAVQPGARRSFRARLTRGLRIYLATPRLRGLLALNLAVAAAGAMVIVNTVVLIQDTLGLDAPDVALALAAFGAGSMTAALVLPTLLRRIVDRVVMLCGGCALVFGCALGPLATQFATVAVIWALIGAGISLVQTPAGRLLRRSSHPEDRPAVFAAQFALSHACWLIAYPVAGYVGALYGLEAAFLTLAVTACLGVVVAIQVWPAGEAEVQMHRHHDLSPNHPHLQSHGGQDHCHPVIIDDLHLQWPSHSSTR